MATQRSKTFLARKGINQTSSVFVTKITKNGSERKCVPLAELLDDFLEDQVPRSVTETIKGKLTYNYVVTLAKATGYECLLENYEQLPTNETERVKLLERLFRDDRFLPKEKDEIITAEQSARLVIDVVTNMIDMFREFGIRLDIKNMITRKRAF